MDQTGFLPAILTSKRSICTVHGTKHLFEDMKDRPNPLSFFFSSSSSGRLVEKQSKMKQVKETSMPIPDYESMMRPILDFLSDGTQRKTKEVYDQIFGVFEMTEESAI